MLRCGGADTVLATQHDMNGKLITYATPATVLAIMNANGSDAGILNTDTGLWLEATGKTYPKGTVFLVSKGSIRAVWG